MKKTVCIGGLLSSMLLMGGNCSWALSSETAMLLDLLKAKGVITQSEADEFAKTLQSKKASTDTDDEHYHSVKSIADRVEQLEKKEAEKEAPSKVRLGGLVEVEGSASRVKAADGTKTNSNDLALAKAQVTADAEINQHVNGRVTFLYEEGENDDNIVLDEALVTLKGGDGLPLYANVGRQYVPFGHFASHFITDPGTLTLGETNDTALVAGYANDIVDLSLGGFSGKVKETGKSDTINSAVASATVTMPGSSKEGVSLSGGISYLSNLAASDKLEAKTTVGGEVADTVGGWSTFVSLAYADQYFFDAEYLGAVDDFAVNDFTFTDADNRRPEAWNLEAASRLGQRAEVALRYGGSDGAGTFLARDEYGAALLYTIFNETSLTVEYLYQKFKDSSDNSQGSVQLAVEF